MPETNVPGLSRIRQISVTVKDLARATAFYRDTLNLPLLFEVPGLSFFDCGGVRLMLSRPETSEFDHPASILYYLVNDIHASTATLRERGVAFIGDPHLVARMPDHDLWLADFRDTEGNVLALMSEIRHASAG